MNLEELLTNLGIDKETVQKILNGMKENKIYTSSEENLDVRYNKLKTDHDGAKNELTQAQALIQELQKATKGDKGLQEKITAYESEVTKLNEELQKTKLDNAIKVALLSEKAVDVDYLTFKMNEQGDKLELDENEKIKGIDKYINDLKVKFPTQFKNDKDKVIQPNQLPNNDDRNVTPSKDQFLKMSYEERVALKQSNEQAYKQLTGKQI